MPGKGMPTHGAGFAALILHIVAGVDTMFCTQESKDEELQSTANARRASDRRLRMDLLEHALASHTVKYTCPVCWLGPVTQFCLADQNGATVNNMRNGKLRGYYVDSVITNITDQLIHKNKIVY